ncbi:EAL domain-containing protein [uncultured Thiohalocapsa sp.]|uniref:putative bifunctional diguanylate cyclase/phosphodiesterase n=1 Tax=uncultured Thiohalocapsa sp. TaxID=768990 RepID=UPI0025D8D013|nr:EAL domain-containing protein [uncultured Thiohalocapsa sp.]
MRLQAKLALALVPLVAGPVLLLGWLAYSTLGADIERDAAADLHGVVHVAAGAVERLVSRSRANLEVFARLPEVEQYARSADDPDRYYLLQPGLLRLLHGFREAYPEYLDIRFLLPDGTVDARATARGWDAGPAVGSRDAEAAARTGAGEPLSMVLHAHDGEPVIDLLRRIELPDDYRMAPAGDARTRGFLGMTVSLEPVYRELLSLPFCTRGHLLLALPDGTVLFDTRAGQPAARLADVPRQLPAAPAAAGRHRLMEGPERLVASHTLSPGLDLFAVLPRSELQAPLWTLKLQTLGLTLAAVMLLGAVLLAWLRGLVLAPLAALRGAAERIGAGELRPSIRVRSDDELGQLAGAVRDMGERLAAAHSQMEHQAFHDHLTDLPNRRLIRELLSEELERAERAGGAGGAGGAVAILFIDIDDFKRINDALGHAAGDALLRAVAERLGALSRTLERPQRTHLARLGGDELLLVLADAVEPDVAADIGARALAAVARPVTLGELRQVVTASIGVALFPRDATDADGLIRAADLAMYAAKSQGRNTICFYSAELNARVAARLRLENGLRQALARQALRLHYQPIVDLASGRVVAFEALLRWRDPDLGDVSPAELIPIAEDTGLILPIGRWVLGEVCRQIVAWRARGCATVPVAVNVSAAQLNREDLAPIIRQVLADYDLTPADLVLEVTESVLMTLDTQSEARFAALRQLGVPIHIDDFGTGCSSLSYLHRFQFDCIKIDAGFIGGVTEPGDARILVTAIIALAHALDTKVIAEGVETPAQAAALTALGCKLGQGYGYARPLAEDAAGALAGRRLAVADSAQTSGPIEYRAAGPAQVSGTVVG